MSKKNSTATVTDGTGAAETTEAQSKKRTKKTRIEIFATSANGLYAEGVKVPETGGLQTHAQGVAFVQKLGEGGGYDIHEIMHVELEAKPRKPIVKVTF